MGGYTGGGGVTAKGIGSLPFLGVSGGGAAFPILGAAGMAINGVSAIFQGIKAAKDKKAFNKALFERPDYQIPQEYQNILSQYKIAYGGDMPGYQRGLNQIGQIGARARGSAERGAISSNAFGASVSAQQQKELDAIMNLNTQNEQFKLQGVDKIAGAEQLMAGQKEQKWNLNEFLPWQTKVNYLGESAKARTEGAYSALNAFGSNLSDLAGTRYLMDAYKGLKT